MLAGIIRHLIETEVSKKVYRCSVCGGAVPEDHLSTPDFRISEEGHLCSQMCYRTFMIMHA
ncbi:MAG: hypothetical protein KAJ47_00935 [Candidatus Aenigmarchaeota archaeon]|nr:hypothetical protein [Candidatus Aenigmarchaeota archaeon]